MVKAKRVCKDWQEIIDANSELWKALILPEREDGWGLEPIELFDEKSKSNLHQVTMPIRKEIDNEAFIGLLERSKTSLRFLEIGSDSRVQRKRIGNEVWTFPKLVECKVLDSAKFGSDCELPPLKKEKGAAHQDHDDSSPLKVLWIWDWRIPDDSELHHLDNLDSLLTTAVGTSSEWRKVLAKSSRTLQQLCFFLKPPEEEEEDAEVTPLEFLQLEFLTVSHYYGSFALPFPAWIEPSSRTTLSCSMLQESLPSVSKLWITFLRNLELLHTRLPHLVELRLEISEDDVDPQEQDALLSAVRQRQRNVESRMEVEGVKMLKLKSIILPFKWFKLKVLSGLAWVVDEVVDSATVPER